MDLWGVLKRLSIVELYRLAVLTLKYPIYIIPTIKATKRTLIICDTYYGTSHHKNGKENAFRHALWNVLICQKTFKITKKTRKSTNWAQKITDLHEKLAPNEPLENCMDLHNNEMGRKFFNDLLYSSEEEIVSFLIQETQKAKEIIEINDVVNLKNSLVYFLEKPD
ncbi:hypothetical protein [Aquimarina sp. AU474]|uniref:DUF6973 domain-containing protein n=1 Tax=Aquimarina sp. AU474 TaxID=2108529 RepID=UPI000D69EABD|nr:hypothetical protein [Aquimarina sp. AU474]